MKPITPHVQVPATVPTLWLFCSDLESIPGKPSCCLAVFSIMAVCLFMDRMYRTVRYTVKRENKPSFSVHASHSRPCCDISVVQILRIPQLRSGLRAI